MQSLVLSVSESGIFILTYMLFFEHPSVKKPGIIKPITFEPCNNIYASKLGVEKKATKFNIEANSMTSLYGGNFDFTKV